LPAQPDSSPNLRFGGVGVVIAALFRHRSGRIIALCRLVMAFVFFMAVWIDPAQPVRATELGYTLIGSYLALSLVLMAVAMTNWWWDHRLAWPLLIVDILAFLGSVFFTEGRGDDFTSPFLAFFTFLMLATTIRWDWRMTAITGLAVTAFYFFVGVGLGAAGIEFDTLRFGRRVAYMLVLALFLMWFGLQRREQHIERFRDQAEPATRLSPPLESALEYAIDQTGGTRGVIAWNDGEEPAIELRTVGIEPPRQRLSPDELPEERAFGRRARLFSADRCRSLTASNNARPIASARRVDEPLADLLGIGEALAMPFSSGTGKGEVIVAGINGRCADDVAIGQLIAREVGAALDRHATLVLSHQTALARSHDALARDLHDSVAQSLAGAALRLEGLRKSINAGNDPEPEILQLKTALRAEQNQVRDLIGRLRQTDQSADAVSLCASATNLVADLSANWAIPIALDCPDTFTASRETAHEIRNLLREAVANAVRHGEAQKVEIGLRLDGHCINLEVKDNGSGFKAGTKPDAPLSIRERVTRRGGTLAVQSGPSGTQLNIALPMGDEA
jgi:signal transduction histidine kinase